MSIVITITFSTLTQNRFRLCVMDSLFDILSNRAPDEPLEIRIVKQYVRDHFKDTALVAIQGKSLVVTVRSSSLAGVLRTRTAAIRQQLGDPDKQLIFRIGQVDS